MTYPAIAPDPLGEPIYRYRRGDLWWHGVYWTEDHTFALCTYGNNLLSEELKRWLDADSIVIVAEDGSVIGEVPAVEVEPVQMGLF